MKLLNLCMLKRFPFATLLTGLAVCCLFQTAVYAQMTMNSSIEGGWTVPRSFDGNITLSGQAASTYSNYVGEFTITKPTDATVRYYIQDQLGSVTTREPAGSNYHGVVGPVVNFRDWQVGYRTLTVLAFSYQTTRGNGIQGIGPGETRTTKLTVQIRKDGATLAEKIITVNITDPTSPPALSITTTQDSVDEGGSIAFTVTASKTPIKNFTVVFNTSESTGNFFNSISTVSFTSGGSQMQSGTVTTIHLSGIQASGSIVVRITDGSDYDVDTSNNNDSISVTVLDLDQPPVLSITTTQDSVDEGNSFAFTVTASKTLIKNFTVVFNTSESTGSFFGSISTVSFTSGGSRMQSGMVTTTRLLGVQESGSIVVRITDGSDYDVDTDNNNDSISVAVHDRDQPFISIYPVSGGAEEGDLAEFLIQASPPPTVDLRINVAVTHTGNILSLRPSSTVVYPSGLNFHQFGVTTNRFNFSGTADTITIEVLPGENYSLSKTTQERTAMMTVRDNGLTRDGATGVSVASLVLGQILAQSQNQTGSEISSSAKFTQHHDLHESSPRSKSTPILSVYVDSSEMNEGDTVRFKLNSTHAVAHDLSVSVDITNSGVSIADGKPTQTSIRAGQNQAVVSIKTVDNGLNRGDGAISLKILPGGGYLVDSGNHTATVKIYDAPDRSTRELNLRLASSTVHSRIMGSLGTHSLHTMTSRVEQAFSPELQNSLELGNFDTMAELATIAGESQNGYSISWRSALGNSSFAIGLLSDSNVAGQTTLWGHADNLPVANYSGGFARNWTGEIFAGQFGVDTRVGEELLIGLAASEYDSEFDYDIGTEQPVRLESSSTGVYPYLGVNPASGEYRLEVVAGFGLSDTAVRQYRYDSAFQTGTFYMIGLNGRKQMYASRTGLGRGTKEIHMTGKTWVTGQYMDKVTDLIPELQTNASHSAIGVKAVFKQSIPNEADYGSSVSIGLRVDDKDEGLYTGLDFASQSTVELPIGLNLTGGGRVLAPRANRIDSWEFSVAMGYDSEDDTLGLLVDFNPVWGRTDARIHDLLWQDNIVGNLSGGPHSNTLRLNAEVAYGYSTQNGFGRTTPFVGIELEGTERLVRRIGSRYSLGTDVGIEIIGEQRLMVGGAISHGLKLMGTIIWQ